MKKFTCEATDKLLSFIGSKICLENWNKFNAYFKCIYEIVKIGEAAPEYMLQKNLIKTLIDFMLGNDSPYATERRIPMGNQGSHQPSFDFQIMIISKLILYCDTPETEEFGEKLERSEKPFFKLDQETLGLIRTSYFSKVALDDGDYRSIDLPEALMLLCYKNYKFSKKLAKELLAGIN